MPLFTINQTKLTPIKEINIGLEKNIQSLVEANLEQVFGLEFVCSELAINNLRFDTLAFDHDTNSFVIIEYKKDRSFSVIDQGFAYLSLMLNNKAEFILEYNEKVKTSLTRDQIDWTQSRVIFVANSFTEHQRGAINFRDLPIELWEFSLYDNNTIHFDQLEASKSAESINTVSADPVVEKITKEVKTYQINDHFHPGWESSKSLYEELSEAILAIDPRITEKAVKHYIGYKVGSTMFCNIKIMKSKITLDVTRFRPEDLNDPEHRLKYVEGSKEHWNVHVSKIEITSSADIPYTIMIVKQVFANTFGK
jgi:predicted transport protein